MDTTYPDELVTRIIVALAERAGMELPVLLRDFGQFLAGGLLRVYEPLVDSRWKTLDVIEHVERHIHTVVRLRDPTAGPPHLTANRLSPTAVEVIYVSPRRLCALAEGIVNGLAQHFGETVTITQPECMLRGDARCLIRVRLQS